MLDIRNLFVLVFLTRWFTIIWTLCHDINTIFLIWKYALSQEKHTFVKLIALQRTTSVLILERRFFIAIFFMIIFNKEKSECGFFYRTAFQKRQISRHASSSWIKTVIHSFMTNRKKLDNASFISQKLP